MHRKLEKALTGVLYLRECVDIVVKSENYCDQNGNYCNFPGWVPRKGITVIPQKGNYLEWELL